jgi:hypothetical protein
VLLLYRMRAVDVRRMMQLRVVGVLNELVLCRMRALDVWRRMQLWRIGVLGGDWLLRVEMSSQLPIGWCSGSSGC